MSPTDEPLTPDVILRDADLAVLGGRLTLRIDLERALFGGWHLTRLLAVDPIYPRRKPVNLLRAAGVADVLVANEGEGAPEMLEMLASALRKAAPQLPLGNPRSNG